MEAAYAAESITSPGQVPRLTLYPPRFPSLDARSSRSGSPDSETLGGNSKPASLAVVLENVSLVYRSSIGAPIDTVFAVSRAC